MSFVPRYSFLPGTEITLFERPMVVNGQVEQGYEVADCETGVITVVPFGRLAEQLKLPGARLDTALPANGARLRQRLGGYATARALSRDQQDLGKFHVAFCRAIELYREKVRISTGKMNYKLSGRKLNAPDVREFIAKAAGDFLGEKVLVNPPRGGKSTGLFLYKGRTLMRYLKEFEDLAPDENPLDALVTLDHLKGNRTARICFEVREMMTEIWEKYGLDLKKPSVSNVHAILEAEIWRINRHRNANGLEPLSIPSRKVMSEHRDMLVTPTEYLIATTGPENARNKRGRGSTDLRALLIGELVQIDECRISLVTSAKMHGFWESMSQNERAALEEMEAKIRRLRLCILVMLDVASRMPLAWVITENPNAEATLALFRMATRDKSREKALYRCTGEPAAAVGLMLVKNDNGTGLRNTTEVSALMGIGSMNQISRTSAPAERSQGERLFGTVEIDLFKLLPGYTGRRPGDLPGYDPVKNGVIDLEQLHELLTRYFIDEYPYKRHYGVGMNGRRPIEVYETINATRGQIPPIDPHQRRIQLGWEEEVTPTDEGVRVFSGVLFNSDELQIKREEYRVEGKVKVFVDPDNMNLATVVLPMVKDPIEVQLQFTAFADMTLPEILRFMASQQREDPQKAKFHDDQLMQARLKRREQIKAINVEHGLARSYSTIEECREKAKTLLRGARILPATRLGGTTPPGEIASLQPSDGVYELGGGLSLQESLASDASLAEELGSQMADAGEFGTTERRVRSRSKAPLDPDVAAKEERLARPKNLKELK